MQPVSLFNSKTYAPNFKGIACYDSILVKDRGKISKKTAKLVIALNEYIDNEWKIIRESNKLYSSPLFSSTNGKKSTFIKPIYNQKYPALLIEQIDGSICKRILLDRGNPNNFRFEKTVETDHGFATLRSYDSRIDNNKEINMDVDNILCNALEDIISTKLMRKFFADDEFVRNAGSIILK